MWIFAPTYHTNEYIFSRSQGDFLHWKQSTFHSNKCDTFKIIKLRLAIDDTQYRDREKWYVSLWKHSDAMTLDKHQTIIRHISTNNYRMDGAIKLTKLLTNFTWITFLISLSVAFLFTPRISYSLLSAIFYLAWWICCSIRMVTNKIDAWRILHSRLKFSHFDFSLQYGRNRHRTDCDMWRSRDLRAQIIQHKLQTSFMWHTVNNKSQTIFEQQSI